MNKNIECPASFMISMITLATYKIVIYTNTEKTLSIAKRLKIKNKNT